MTLIEEPRDLRLRDGLHDAIADMQRIETALEDLRRDLQLSRRRLVKSAKETKARAAQ